MQPIAALILITVIYFERKQPIADSKPTES